MSSKRSLLSCFIVFMCFFLSACENNELSPKNPVTLTMWHVYGAQTQSPMNQLIASFNQSVGKENGIKVEVSSVSNSTAIHNSLIDSAKNKAGAPNLPDIFTCYPKTLEAMGSDIALDWSKFFSSEELKAFVPEFLNEGYLNDRLVLFPLAKSSNALFINSTTYDKFAQETNHTYKDLETWEKVFKTIEAYHKWSNGKAFFMYDDWIHYPFVNMQAEESSLFKDNKIDWKNPKFIKVMQPLIRSAIMGEVCLMPGYSTKAIMIDEAVSGVESTASVLYFKDHVTFKDNSTIPLRIQALPVPYFEGSKRIALQRGVGLVALKSDEHKEEAIAIFCKWLTSEGINLNFAMQGGYMPVRISDFQKLNSEIDSFEFPRNRYRSLYESIVEIYNNNSFIITPNFEEYGTIEQAFAKNLREVLTQNRDIWSNSEKSEELLNELINKSFVQLEEKMMN